MRYPIIIILFLIVCIPRAEAQRKDSFVVKTQFENQGEQEDYLAEKFFHEKYKKEHYKRFTGEINTIDTDHIRFGNKILSANFATEFKSIFTKGIFYPQIITGDSVAPKKSKKEIDKMTTAQKFFYNMSQNDTLSIGELEELKFLSKSPKTKRFRFWRYQKGSANPTVYFIELTNSAAIKSTNMENFIKGATLTFVKEGWIIM